METNLTREQAVAIVGEKSVDAVERMNCEPTNLVGVLGSCQGDDLIEWSASVEAQDSDGDDVTLNAYYYTTDSDEEIANEHGWDMVEFAISHYEVV